MSSDDLSIRVEGLAKRYEVYAEAVARLKQMTLPKVRRHLHLPHKAYFQEFWALRGVTFDLRRGETIGIIGRNGSGKSTLLQIICGTLAPTWGNVDVRGRVAALLELGAGFNPEFTGRENVYLNAAVLGLAREEIDRRFDSILAFADIGEFIERPVKTYSSGMYIRLAFAVAINVDPEILVVDEALAVGDEAFQRKCFARIKQIRDNGATVLFVSHSVGSVIDLCDRAILLDAGELLVQGTPKFVVSRYHKLLYAPAEKLQEIRDHMRGSDAVRGTETMASARHDAAVPAEKSVTDEGAYLEPGLVSKSMVRYEQRGATIADACIETMDGRRVNVLCRGHEYVYRYNATFSSTAVAVRFGMMIKTLTGVELGGAASAPHGMSDLTVSPNEAYEIRFRFHAGLAPGAYFMNAGVTAFDADGETFLDRVIDIVMFRVQPDAMRLQTGMADLVSMGGMLRIGEVSA